MFAALIFVVSAAMLAQFTVAFWRANMLATAARPVSERLHLAEESFARALEADGFSTLVALNGICPDMSATSAKFGKVRAYYRLLHAASNLGQKLLPAAAAWANREMASCTRYAAVAMDHRLQGNQEFSAALRSF